MPEEISIPQPTIVALLALSLLSFPLRAQDLSVSDDAAYGTTPAQQGWIRNEMAPGGTASAARGVLTHRSAGTGRAHHHQPHRHGDRRGVPSGFSFYSQWWIDDPAGPLDLAASNALQGTAP